MWTHRAACQFYPAELIRLFLVEMRSDYQETAYVVMRYHIIREGERLFQLSS